jgi:3-oxoacyl-[acyl-carrier protein] reductase
MPGKGQGLYASSKLAAEGIYRNVGLELAARGITTMSLRPGYVESGRGDKFIGKNRQTLLKKIPGGCFISEAEVAKTLLFFLSDTGIAFNGVNLTMDGGMTCGK